jgi:hypothetical protein
VLTEDVMNIGAGFPHSQLWEDITIYLDTQPSKKIHRFHMNNKNEMDDVEDYFDNLPNSPYGQIIKSGGKYYTKIAGCNTLNLSEIVFFVSNGRE